MTPEEVRRLRELAGRLLPGPWTAHGEPWVRSWLVDANQAEIAVGASERRKEMEFCAAARTAVPALCDEVERLRGRVEEAEGLLRHLVRDGSNLGYSTIPPDAELGTEEWHLCGACGENRDDHPHDFECDAQRVRAFLGEPGAKDEAEQAARNKGCDFWTEVE